MAAHAYIIPLAACTLPFFPCRVAILLQKISQLRKSINAISAFLQKGYIVDSAFPYTAFEVCFDWFEAGVRLPTQSMDERNAKSPRPANRGQYVLEKRRLERLSYYSESERERRKGNRG